MITNSKKVYAKIWWEANKEKVKEKRKSSQYAKKHYNENRDRYIETSRNWRKNNKAHRNFLSSNYTYRKRRAAPIWLTSDQLKEIKYYYELAQEVSSLNGEEYHVDHIVPLKGKNVCGLHVPWNLQILPAKVNKEKSNTYD